MPAPRTLLRRVVLLFGVGVALFLGLRALESAMLYPMPGFTRAWLDEQAAAQGATVHDVLTEDGVRLYGWHVPAGGTTTVLWFEGNGGSVGQRAEEFERLHALGADVVQVNYRGYPGSEGRPSEVGLRADARAAWALAEQVAPGARRVAFGKSLGGGVAVGLCAERACDSLITESTFSSAARAGKQMLPLLPVDWLMRDRFDSVALAPRVSCPVLMLHGEDDHTVPIEHVTDLAAAFPSPPTIVRIPGAGHNDRLLLDERAWPTVASRIVGG